MAIRGRNEKSQNPLPAHNDLGLVSHADIAAMLGISRKAVWETEQRAIRKIKQAILSDETLLEAVRCEGFGA